MIKQWTQWLLAGTCCLSLVACQGPVAQPTTTLQPTSLPATTAAVLPTVARLTPGVTPTVKRTATPKPSASPTVAKLTPCANAACAAQVNHFWLERPVPIGDYSNGVEASYRYGSTQEGVREPHHGVEFSNPQGTPILAAAAGEVVVAGTDDQALYGPYLNFYGNLIVVRLDQTYNGQPVFNLYAHLQQVSAAVGDKVQTGDFLGTVGSTGIAIGPHLHFEVRVGQNDYASTRNPELWFRPLPLEGNAQGVVAGRVVDTTGKLVPEVTIVLRPVNVQADYIRNFYFSTYTHDPDRINGDDALQENFAITDIPPGTYTLSVNTTKFYQQTIVVEAGKIAWQTFRVAPLPPTPIPSETPEFVATPEESGTPCVGTTLGVEGSPGVEATPCVETTPNTETATPGEGTPGAEVTPTTEVTAEATPEPTATP